MVNTILRMVICMAKVYFSFQKLDTFIMASLKTTKGMAWEENFLMTQHLPTFFLMKKLK